MPSSASCIQTSILLHSKHAASLHSPAGGEKAVFATKRLVTKREFRPHLCIFRRAGGQARKRRCAPKPALKRPASCSPSLFSPSLIPIFKGKRQFEKKNGFEWNKTPSPPNPRHYGAVTLGGEGGKEHFGGATLGGAAVGRLGMSVLRDATYATLGARASLRACRDTRSHFEVAYDGVARLARPQTRTCICLVSSRRGCAVSAFFALGRLGPHMRLCARNGPFPRGFSALAIFFHFFKDCFAYTSLLQLVHAHTPLSITRRMRKRGGGCA